MAKTEKVILRGAKKKLTKKPDKVLNNRAEEHHLKPGANEKRSLPVTLAYRKEKSGPEEPP